MRLPFIEEKRCRDTEKWEKELVFSWLISSEKGMACGSYHWVFSFLSLTKYMDFECSQYLRGSLSVVEGEPIAVTHF